MVMMTTCLPCALSLPLCCASFAEMRFFGKSLPFGVNGSWVASPTRLRTRRGASVPARLACRRFSCPGAEERARRTKLAVAARGFWGRSVRRRGFSGGSLSRRSLDGRGRDVRSRSICSWSVRSWSVRSWSVRAFDRLNLRSDSRTAFGLIAANRDRARVAAGLETAAA